MIKICCEVHFSYMCTVQHLENFNVYQILIKKALINRY